MLHCHNLSVQLQQALVLHPLDLEIQRNERWVIIGRNGSGKTSLLKAIANLLPFTGDVTFNQKSLSRMKHEDKAKLISYVPQHSNVDSRLTLQEYIRLTSSPPLPSQPFIETVTRALKIDSLLDKRLGQLSGGQKQRAHIARALCQQTEFMVLDEPLNHLDPCAQGEVLSLLKQKNTTLICSLHDITLAAKFATHIAILERGRLIAKGRSETLLSQQQLQSIFDVDVIHATNTRTLNTSPFLDIELVQGTT